jgi:hypothetical protein
MAAITTYAEFYNLPENDPYNGDYSTLFPPFAVALVPGVSAGIRTRVAQGADAKVAMLFLGTDAKLHVLHRIRRYTPAIGTPPSPNDGLDFATFDETTPTGPSTVVVPAPLFNLTAGTVPILTPDQIDLYLAANPAAAQYQPDPATQAQRVAAGEMTPIRTRRGMLIPPFLTGAIIAATSSPDGLSPAALWTDFVTLVRQHAHAAHMELFVQWARFAFASGIDALNAVALPPPPLLHLDPMVGGERRRVLLLDFPPPGIVPGLGGADPLVAELVATRLAAADRDQARLLREQQQKVAAALPSKRWGLALPKLLRLCQVGAEQDLPEVWTDMVTHGVKNDVTTIKAHLDILLPQFGECGKQLAPICSPEMAKSVGRLDFQSHADDLESGIHIFGVCYPTQASIAQANALARLFAEQSQSTTSLTMAEAQQFKKAQALLLPKTLVELKHVLYCYLRFLAVLLGVDHPVVLAFYALCVKMGATEMTLHVYFTATPAHCGSVLRFIQLEMFAWIEDQLLTDDVVAPPDFAIVLKQIARLQWIAPPLPLAYRTPPSRNLNLAPAGGGDVKAGGDAKAGGRNLLDRNVRAMQYFTAVKFIAAHGPPPVNDHGNDMCLNFHVRAKCRKGCPRVADHIKHTPAETTRLNAYLSSPRLDAAVVDAAVVAT